MKTANAIISGRDVYCVPVGTTVFSAVQFMAEKNVGAIGVVDNLAGKKLLGIFSERDLLERDLLKRVVLNGIDAKSTKIDDVMTKNVAVARAQDSYNICLDLMKKVKSRHLPIVDGDKLVGMVSMRDMMEAEIEEQTTELRMMNSYIHDMPGGM